MKSKTPANAALEIIQPQQIINRHLRPAIAPFKAELLAAAELDRKLSETMSQEHPNAVKLAAEELFQKATSGDTEAEAAIRAEGGMDEWKRKRIAFFDLSRAKHEAACVASVPLWTKVSVALLAAIEDADREIQGQWAKVCDFLGEPCDLSRWNAYCRNIRHGIERTPYAAEKLRHGSSWQLEAYGLRELLD
jgi:hypothetical protein